jgi:hypothetical protein
MQTKDSVPIFLDLPIPDVHPRMIRLPPGESVVLFCISLLGKFRFKTLVREMMFGQGSSHWRLQTA